MAEALIKIYDRLQLSYESFLLKKKLWAWTAALLVLQACLLGVLKPELAFVVVMGLLGGALGVVYPDQAIFFYFLASWFPIVHFGRVESRHGIAQGLYPTEVMLGFLVFVWVFRMVSDRDVRFRLDRTDAALIGLCGAYFLANLVSYITWPLKILTSHRYIITQLAQVGIVFMCASAYWIVANGTWTERWLRRMLYAVIGLSVFLAFVKLPLIRELWMGVGKKIPRDDLLIVQGSMLAFGLGVYARGKKRLRWFLLGAFPFSVVAVNLSWVSGWLASMTALFTLTLFRSRKHFLAFVGFSMIVVAFNWSYFDRRLIHHSRVTGDFHRFFLMEDAVKIWKERPWFGVGPGNYYQVYTNYYAQLWNRPIHYSSAHTNYGEILATTGIVGFSAFWIFFCLMGWDLYQYWRKAADPVQKGFLLGIMAGAAGLMAAGVAGDYIIPDRANLGLKTFSIAVYFWLLLGAAKAIGRRWLVTEPSE